MLNPRKLSQDPVFNNLLPRDKVVLLRSPLDEPDASKRNGTASLDALAAALTSRLPGDYTDLSLIDAQALPDADPPGVKPMRLYGITGDWNATGTNATVYVQGVRPNAYHTLGVVYDDQGLGQLVAVDVVAGTYGSLVANKADLDPATGILAVGQAPGAGYGLLFNPIKNEYAYNDGVLFTGQILPNSRVDAATGQVKTVFGYTTLIYSNVPQGITLKSSSIKLLYACYQNYSSGAYLKAWYREPSANAISSSDLSTTPIVPATNQLGLIVSVLNADVTDLHIAPLNGYDDTALKAELAKRVKTVNGVAPDANGNVQVAAGTGTGTSYTDTLARAAQLNRVAAAGMTTVTLTAESPTDYGTAASGIFTVDATNCVVGKVVRFVVGNGAGAPVFTNAPAGQPFKKIGVPYVNGKDFSYMLLVCVDRIEVLILPD